MTTSGGKDETRGFYGDQPLPVRKLGLISALGDRSAGVVAQHRRKI